MSDKATLRLAFEEIDALRAEIARLRKAIVWAVGWAASHETASDGARWLAWGHSDRRHIRTDGTDESMIATVCRLAEEG